MSALSKSTFRFQWLRLRYNLALWQEGRDRRKIQRLQLRIASRMRLAWKLDVEARGRVVVGNASFPKEETK